MIQNEAKVKDVSMEMKKLKLDYEKRLNNQKSDLERELYNKFLELQCEIQQNKQTFEQEKETITVQTEERISVLQSELDSEKLKFNQEIQSLKDLNSKALLEAKEVSEENIN